MTYLQFLLIFIGIPLLIVAWLNWRDMQTGRELPAALRSWSVWRVILAHVVVAVVYTTPWDNYLVATGVWGYLPERILGILIGWVPIEEYTFFVVQTLLAGGWFAWLARRIGQVTQPFKPSARIRWLLTAPLIAAWLWSLYPLISGWQPGTYLALIWVWALPPIMLQTFFFGDVLWHHRKLAFTVLGSMTLYLSLADTLAIAQKTWLISETQTLGWLLGGVLPFEEFMFFLMTNTLIGVGMTLILAAESQTRVPPIWLARISRVTGLAK